MADLTRLWRLAVYEDGRMTRTLPGGWAEREEALQAQLAGVGGPVLVLFQEEPDPEPLELADPEAARERVRGFLDNFGPGVS